MDMTSTQPDIAAAAAKDCFHHGTTAFRHGPARGFKALEITLRKAIGTRWGKAYYGGRLVRIGRHQIVKANPYLRLAEARALEFVAKNTTIPVPRVLDTFTHDGMLNMVMDYIDAPALDTIWPQMSEEERKDIITQLQGFLLQLRTLPPPNPGQVYSVDGSGLFDIRQQNTPFGPFESIHAFHEFIGINYVSKNLDEESAALSSNFEKFFGRAYSTTFTHGDLAPRNILVKNGTIVAIIDWECAGWYPEYWEYTSCYRSNLQCVSFWKLLKDSQAIGSYLDELAVDQHLSSILVRC